MTPHDALARLVAAVEAHLIDAAAEYEAEAGSGRFPLLDALTAAQAALEAGEPVMATDADRLTDATLRDYAPNDNVLGWMATDLLATRAALAQAERKFEIARRAADRWVPCPDHRDKVNGGVCQVCRAEQAERERDALRSSVADLTASLKVAQESLRQREAAQRAAEARLETQIQAAYTAQEAQLTQGWKLHESETALKRLVNALVRCESNRGRFACTEVHDSRCPKSRATRAEDWRGEWICACGADELDQAIEAAARVCGLDAARE